MKVLFVSSGNSGDIGVLVKNQGESIEKEGVEIDYFLIQGKGLWGYIRNIHKIRKAYKRGNYQLVHAHYSLTAFVVSLSGCFPMVVSLMGSDAYLSGAWRFFAKVLYSIRWKVTIVKTERMRELLRIKKAFVLPNGVDLARFYCADMNSSRLKLGLSLNEKIVVFIADPTRIEKNYPLAEESIKLLNRSDVRLLPVSGVSNSTIPDYMNAADVLLLTSKWEGSVNVVKEAMACNLPIVSTDVGDVRINIQGVDGCFVTTENPEDIAKDIIQALKFNKRTNGREKLISLGLDSQSVAKRIIQIYEELVHAK